MARQLRRVHNPGHLLQRLIDLGGTLKADHHCIDALLNHDEAEARIQPCIPVPSPRKEGVIPVFPNGIFAIGQRSGAGAASALSSSSGFWSAK